MVVGSMDFPSSLSDGLCSRASCGGLCLSRHRPGPLLATAGLGWLVGLASDKQSDASGLFSECSLSSSVGVVARGSFAALVPARDSVAPPFHPRSCWIGAGHASFGGANIALGLDACLPSHHFWAASLQATGPCFGIACCLLGVPAVVTADGKAPGLCRLWFFQHLSDQASGAAQ